MVFSQVSEKANSYHTYSPVNIKQPDLSRHPRFAHARGFSCHIKEGETLYLPGHWWHEVESTSDAEGKNIGINTFFEPWYNRLAYNTTLNFFQRNRFYSHLQELGSARPCDSKRVCFRKKKKSGEGGSKRKKSTKNTKGKKVKKRTMVFGSEKDEL